MGITKSKLQMPRCRGVEIEELSIQQLTDHLHKKTFTSKELTRCYLKRIEMINPRIKAVIETNPDVLAIANELDEERRNGNVRSKIHGIPFLVKDNIATKDKMQTTAGSAALIGTTVPDDARVVALLRAAGGILLGKANLSEWASMTTLKLTPLEAVRIEILTTLRSIREGPALEVQAQLLLICAHSVLVQRRMAVSCFQQTVMLW